MIRDAGDSAILIELEPVIDPASNAHAIAIAAALRAMHLRGVRDIVSTYRSVAVYFDPLVTTPGELRLAAEQAREAPAPFEAGRLIEVPVVYDGADLDALARQAGMTPEEVAARHAAVEYRVYMLGFLPGFAYMGSVDPSIATPRRATPRLRVPAGAVGIAGRQTGIYPCESPGGWQLIGHTRLSLFDPARQPASLFAPGDRVRFVRDSRGAALSALPRNPERIAPCTVSDAELFAPSEPAITVLNPGLLTTIQDAGRWGHQGTGVSVAGALDQVSFRVANQVVGNAADAAVLEATIAGPELRFERATTLAIAGADLSPSLDGSPAPLHEAIACAPGSVLRFGARRSGARAYLAVTGGIDVQPILQSRSTHALTGVGGRALKTGDRLPAGDSTWLPPSGGSPFASARGGQPSRLRVLPGPQESLFPTGAIERLTRTRFEVSLHSNRMGYRLAGGTMPPPVGEMISDATFTGAIQVPSSGEPILLLTDRQTIGGYPQLAVVITADLPLAAQLAPGDSVEFAVCTRDEAIAALREQELSLGA